MYNLIQGIGFHRRSRFARARRAISALIVIGAAAGIGAGVVYLSIPERKPEPVQEELFELEPSTNGLPESLSMTNVSLKFDCPDEDLPVVNNVLTLGQ